MIPATVAELLPASSQKQCAGAHPCVSCEGQVHRRPNLIHMVAGKEAQSVCDQVWVVVEGNSQQCDQDAAFELLGPADLMHWHPNLTQH